MTTSAHISITRSCFHHGRQLTYDLLTTLPWDVINLRFPKPGFDTVGQQLAEIGDVTMIFADSIETGVLSFDKVRSNFPDELIGSRKKLLEYLQKTDRLLDEAIMKMGEDIEVDIYGKKSSLLEVLIGLVQHESLHHGQLALFFHYNKVSMPASWGEWMMIENQSISNNDSIVNYNVQDGG